MGQLPLPLSDFFPPYGNDEPKATHPAILLFHREINLVYLGEAVRELTECSNAEFRIYPQRPLPSSEELCARLDKLSDAEIEALKVLNDGRPFYGVKAPFVRATVAKLVSKRPVPEFWRVEALTKTERFVLLARYGMLDHQDWLITQIAGRSSMSTRTVNKILDRAYLRVLGRKVAAKARRAAKVARPK